MSCTQTSVITDTEKIMVNKNSASRRAYNSFKNCQEVQNINMYLAKVCVYCLYKKKC